MSKAYWDKRAQQNRQKRAQNKANQWNKGKLNRTHKNYVAGDYKASASDRAYGYRQNKQIEKKYFQTSFTGGRSKSNYARMQKGEDPYKATYYYDGVPRTVDGKYGKYTSRKRFLTDEEKEVFAKTGDLNIKAYNDKYKYKIDPTNGNKKGFENQGHVFKDGKFNWDGMRVARNRVKDGQSKWNYVGGFLKDVVLDPAIRSLQYVDRLGGISTGAIAGTVENATNLFKGEKVDRNRISKNIKESLDSTDNTGWSKGFGDYWEDFQKRNVANDIKFYEEKLNSLSPSERTPEVEAHYKKLIDNAEKSIDNGIDKAFRSIGGFAFDVTNVLDLGGALVDGTKASVKTFKKGLKEGGEVAGLMPKSSQELYEVGLKHKDMLERMKAYKKYLQEEYIPKFGNKIDDEKAWKLFENSSQAEEYAQNFGYMANNIDQTINHSLDNGFNRAMGKAEEVKEVVKLNPATQNLGKFLDELKPVEVESTNDVFEQTYKGFLTKKGKIKEDELFEMLDNIDDDFSYGMLDWLQKNDPKIYQKYIGDIADNVDDHVNVLIEQGSKVNESYLTNPTKKLKSEIFEASKNKVNELNDNYNKNVLERMMKRDEYVVPKRAGYGALKEEFSNFANNVKEQVIKGDRTFYNKVNEVVSKIDINKLAKDDSYKMQVIDLLNNELFGKNFIRQNIKKGSLKSFVEHLDDIRAYNVAKESGQFSFKPHGNYPGTKNGIHYMTNRNGKPNAIEFNNSLFAPSLLDDMFDEKMSFVDSLVGVKHKSELTKPFEELKALAKQEGFKLLDAKDKKLLSDIADGKASNSAKIHLDEKMLNLGLSKLSDEQQRLYKSLEHRLNVRDSAYAEIKNMEFADFEKYKKNFKGEKSVLDDMYEKNIEKARLSFNDVAPEQPEKSLEVAINKKAKRKGLDNKSLKEGHEYKREMQKIKRLGEYHEKVVSFAKEKGFDLPEVTKAKVKLSKNQTLGSLPPVKKNLEGLKTLIKKEVEEMYTDPTSYAKNKSMYDSIKKDFIKGLRSYGVPDNAYFEKAKNLKKLEEEVFKKNLNKKVDSLLDNYKPSGGKGSNELKMNLQLLASKVDEMFDELGKIDVDSLSKAIGDTKSVSKTSLDDLAKVKADDSYNPFAKFTDDFDAVTKEGKEIKLPEDYTINQTTGEVGEIATKKPSKEVQELIDYVEEEKLFDGFNESIGDERPSFEKFKKWYKDGSHMPYDDNKVFDLYKRWLNSWKKGLTIYNSGWHFKNFFQNKGQSFLGIGMDAFGSQKQAKELLKNMRGLENNAKGVLQKNGTYYSPEDITRMAKRYGVINGFNDLIKESRGIISPLETAVDNSNFMRKLTKTEEVARLHHFRTELLRGATPEEAVKSVNKYLFDYGNQTKLDRFMTDFIDPFWIYHKNNARLMSTQSIENGDKVAKTMRGVRGLQNDVTEDEKAKQQYREIQSPIGHFVDKKNKDRYNYQYDMDLFPKLEGSIPMEKDDVMSKLNPLIKLAIQQSEGVGNFDNKVVDKEEADWGEVTKKERYWEMAKEVNPFMNPLIKAYDKSKEHQKKADEGKQSQETSDKQILMDWLEYIFGNKGNYYRDVK